MSKNKYLLLIAAGGFAASLIVALPAFAQTIGAPGGWGGHGGGMMHGGMGMQPGVFGTVSAINGTTLTVTSKARMRPNTTSTAATTVYTVNASNAQVFKNAASSSLSSIATGDMVMVQGTVSGSNVTATTIRDGLVPGMGVPGMGMGRYGGMGHNGTTTLPIQGNGEPIVGGSVSAISGTTLTVTNASNVTYTIDASNAKIVENGTSTAFSNIAVGDNVIVQGTVNGNSVTASSVIDQGNSTHASSSTSSSGGPRGGGFFGAIGSFFKHLFGF